MTDRPKMEWQGRYAICFDFPEFADEPLFAGWHKGAPGFAPSLATAMRFPTDGEAEAMLRNSYGAETQKFGTVVEVGNQSPGYGRQHTPYGDVRDQP